jgi:hypothetical protein
MSFCRVREGRVSRSEEEAMKNTRCALLITGTVLMLSACGGSGSGRLAHLGPPVCNRRDVEAMSHFLRVGRNTIRTSRSIGNNGMPQCTFVTRRSAHHRVLVVANVDDSSQPYQVLRRTIEEASQFFNVYRPTLAPSNVPGLGISASWFPDYHWLLATDGLRLITARVAWTHATQRHKIALAEVMIRPYLKNLSRQQVSATVSGGTIR